MPNTFLRIHTRNTGALPEKTKSLGKHTTFHKVLDRQSIIPYPGTFGKDDSLDIGLFKRPLLSSFN